MIHIADSLTDLVGNTPLLALKRYAAEKKLPASVIAKVEYMNPLFSVKDRVGIAMIEDAEKKGLLKEGSTIIEPTSGNTGIALAFAAAARGYRLIIVMPDTMSAERRKMVKHLGARVELSDGREGMAGAIRRARELAEEIPGSFIPSQFDNPANPGAHRDRTGPEIWRDTDGKVDIFVAGVGSGGTVSGAALAAAGVIARRPENKGKMIVVLLPDSAERYMSTPLFED